MTRSERRSESLAALMEGRTRGGVCDENSGARRETWSAARNVEEFIAEEFICGANFASLYPTIPRSTSLSESWRAATSPHAAAAYVAVAQIAARLYSNVLALPAGI